MRTLLSNTRKKVILKEKEVSNELSKASCAEDLVVGIPKGIAQRSRSNLVDDKKVKTMKDDTVIKDAKNIEDDMIEKGLQRHQTRG